MFWSKKHKLQEGSDSDIEAMMAQIDADFAGAQKWYESEHRDPLVVADFKSKTGGASREIVIDEHDHFILDGHGQVTAQQILEWDRQGLLSWLNADSRDLVKLHADSE